MESRGRVVLVLAALGVWMGFRLSLTAVGKGVSRDSLDERMSAITGTPRPKRPGTWQAPAMIALFCVGAGVLLYRRNREMTAEEQTRRDAEAERISSGWAHESDQRIDALLAEGNEEPFVLYLRPFMLEERFSQKYTFLRLLRPGGVVAPDEVRFDYLLVQSLAKLEIPVICLGHRESTPGAGRVETADEEWEALFHRLAWRAKAIVVVPGDRPGVVEEFRWLKASWMIGKAVFFRPFRYPEQEWVSAREAFAAEGGNLPAWEPNQISFRMYPSGAHFDVTRWRRSIFTTQARTEQDLRSSVLFRDLG